MPAQTPAEILDALLDALGPASEIEHERKRLKLRSPASIGTQMELESNVANGTQQFRAPIEVKVPEL